MEKRAKGRSEETEMIIPKARKEGLIIRVLGEETLVYDLERDRAHCLNRLAALIWQHCDGKTTTPELISLLEDKFPASEKEDLVLSALHQLSQARLLQGKFKSPEETSRLSRRDVIRKLGRAAAISLPLVTSITAPARADIGTPPPPPGPPPASQQRPLQRPSKSQNRRNSR